MTNNWYYCVIKGKNKFIALAKKEPFTNENPDPIREPGTLFFEFGNTPKQAIAKLKKTIQATPKEKEVLKSMLAGEELVQSLPGGWWLEDRQIGGRVGWSLLRKAFISEVQGSSPNFIRYYINEWGRDAIPKDESPEL